ncbi:MAG: heparinase II/III family protein, partial [Phycisphaerae bacterium]|nr:heparinase II/III family protein [Phycisphaerae bacterium]
EMRRRVRRPVGFRKIDTIEFSNRWRRGTKVDTAVVLTIKNLRLLSEKSFPQVKGPRMSDKQFFDALNLDHPGLAKAKSAVAKGDFKAARHAMAEHIRHRKKPLWSINPNNRPTIGMPLQKQRGKNNAKGQYRATVNIDGTGENKIILKKSDFKPHNKPVGWNWISGVSLLARVAGEPAEAILHLDDCKLVGPESECGIGDFEVKVTGRKNEARCVRASGKKWIVNVEPKLICKKFPGAWTKYDRMELRIHSKKPVKIEITVVVNSVLPNTRIADKLLEHKLHKHFLGKRIDWSFNPYKKGPSRTIEWTASLNRHFHFKYLVRAYWQTGDEKYARELAHQMNAFIEDCPVFLFGSGNSSPYHHAWGTLNIACRLQDPWPDAIYSCILSPEFTDDIIINIVKSIAEQVRHLIKHPSGGNWLTAESLSVYTMGALFPEYKEAKQWREIGIERLYNQLSQAVYPDGMQYELALKYNNWVLREYIRVITIARRNGLMNEIPSDYKARLEKMFSYLMYNCMPNGEGVALNDSGLRDVTHLLIPGYGFFPGRSDFLYAASAGQCGRRPARDSVALPYTGHYVMRSGWDKNARMLHFDAGLFGAGHQHEDKLHVSMYAYGKQLLLDAGSYHYNRSKWRVYALLTRSHNTVLVDGMDQCRKGSRSLYIWPKPWAAPSPKTDTRWISTHGLDYCVGLYKHKYREFVDFQHPKKNPRVLNTVQHARKILFVKPDFWIIHDTLTAKDDKKHTCDVLFHINANEAKVDSKTNAVTSICKDAPGVTIFPLNVGGLKAKVVKGKENPPVQGWTAYREKLLAVPTAIFSKKWHKSTDVVTVLYPFVAGAKCPVKSVTPIESKDGVIAARITLADGSDHIYLSNPKPGNMVKLAGIETDGEVAEACAQPGKNLRLLLVNGRSLACGKASVTLGKHGSVSVTGYADGLYRVGVDVSTQCEIKIPGLAANANVKIHKIDNDLNRVSKVSATIADGVIKCTTKAGDIYAISIEVP